MATIPTSITTERPAAARSPERWLQRFANFEKVLKRLEGHLESRAEFRDPDLLTGLVLRHYSFCLELSWKTLRDLLTWNGIDARLPREVLKQAFATGLIENGQLWIDMLEHRPRLTADGELEGDDGSPEGSAALAAAVQRLEASELPALQALQRSLAERRTREGEGHLSSTHSAQGQPAIAPQLPGLPEQTTTVISRCLKQQFPQLHWVKLYGSRAIGHHWRGSDIDLAYSADQNCSEALHEALDQLPTPYLFDVTHWESLRHQGLRDHIERVGRLFP